MAAGLAKHFYEAFAEAEANVWFTTPGTPQLVSEFFHDLERGRELREEAVNDKMSAEHLAQWRRIHNQAQGGVYRWWRRKVGRDKDGKSRTTADEAWYAGVDRPITAADWHAYWNKKSAKTASGASGLRPDQVKAAPEELTPVWCALYSASVALKIVPAQWRQAIVVPIPKKAGATALKELRPLKLLEITKKAVMSIIKDRITEVLEREGLFDNAQHGFRRGRSTHTAAIRLVDLAEEARRLGMDLHVLLVDIKKAYDSVVRALGVEGALRRMGVPLSVAEFFMEGERDSINTVRTVWDGMLGEDTQEFEALMGFTQGAAESPLLWIIFMTRC